MSDMAKKARSDMKSKAQRIASADPHQKVDASGWTPPEALNTIAKVGMRPLSRRQYRHGGMVHGHETARRGDRKPRKSGGMTIDDFLNRDQKMANEKREGGKEHIGGYKRGGHADAAEDKKLIHAEIKKHEAGCRCAKCSGGRTHKAHGGKSVTDGTLEGTRPTGGRLAKKAGGRAKGKTNINIIIAQPKQGMPGGPMAPPHAPVGVAPPPPRPMAPPPQAPMGPAAGAPPPMPMARKTGGRAYPIDAGAGGGRGRLEKAARA